MGRAGTLRRFRSVAIKRPDGYISVRVRRRGVESTAGCIVAAPIWLWTRMRWQFSSRQWTAEMAVAGRLGVGRTVKTEAFATHEAAMARALEWCAAVEGGENDG